MRPFILIAAMLLMSASAQAEERRGLSLASDKTVAAEQPKATETPSAETPKLAEQSPASDAAPEQPNADQTAPDQVRPDRVKGASSKTEKPKYKRNSLESRVIDELHRHGIYW